MKTPTNKTSVLASSLLAFLASGALAQAQEGDVPSDEDTAVLDTVLVQGIRQSLDEARDLKRADSQFIDAIVAEDIGKLPDTNIAESLGRVSGVQIDRGIGAGTDISVRGLRQNVILYNGRQIYDGLGRGGAGLDQLQTSTYGLLATIPSELVGRLEVNKLPGADDIAGALGGIVDIQSRKPLDKPGQQVSLKAGLTYDEIVEGNGSELFGLYSNTFANDTLGVLVSGTLNKRDLGTQGLDTFVGYATISTANGIGGTRAFTDSAGNPISNDPNGDGIPGILHIDPRASQIEESREHLGLNAVIQWRPNENLELMFDALYSENESDRDRRWLGVFTGFGDWTNVVINNNEVLTSGTVTRPMNSNVAFADNVSEISSYAFSGDYQATDRLNLSAELAFGSSSGDYDQRFLRLQPLVTQPADFDILSGDFGLITSGSTFDDPSTLGFPVFFFQHFTSDNDDVTLRGDLEYEFNDSLSFSAGLRHQELETEFRQRTYRPGGFASVSTAADLGNLIELFSNPDFLPGEFPGLPRNYFIFNEAAVTVGGDAIESCVIFDAFASPEQQATCQNLLNDDRSFGGNPADFNIDEEFIEAYSRLDFETQMGEIPVSGNVGVRYVDRQLTSEGVLINTDGTQSPNVFTRSDTEFLPSAALKFDLTDNLVGRLGAARVQAFPNTVDLTNNLVLTAPAPGGEIGSGSGGGANLDPFLATQFDASLEWYFAESSLLSVGLFYKDVESFILSEVNIETIGGNDFAISRNVNDSGGEVQGIELLYQQPFDFLPGPWDGFGVIGTYTYIDSTTPTEDPNGNPLPFPGLSENNVNLIGYYENELFSARLAYNWRDDYLQGLGPSNSGTGGTNAGVFFDAYEDLSFTARYNVTENVTLGFEALNLLDSQLRTYNAYPEALRTNNIYGQIFKASISANF